MPIKIGYLTRILALLVVLGAVAGVDAARNPARALGVLQCSFTVTNVAFGSVDVLTGAAYSSSATLTISCTGVSILPTNVYACVTFPTPRAMTGPMSPTLQYDLLGPPPLMTSWSNTTAIVIPTSGSILGFNANATVSVPATLLANQQSTPAGSYSQTVNATMNYSTSSCTSGLIVGTNSSSFQVSANVVKSCNVAATNLNFGTAGILNAAVNGQTEIDVQCSNGTGYSIGLNGGLTGATDPTQRKMAFGAKTVTYGLYQDAAHASPWGSASSTNEVAATGTSVSQPFQVYGYISIQPTPPPGTYSDTIIVSVTY